VTGVAQAALTPSAAGSLVEALNLALEERAPRAAAPTR
jgi:hypothetical protein